MEKLQVGNMAVADFNGDGLLDLAVNTYNSGTFPSVVVFFGTREGRFKSGAAFGPVGVTFPTELVARDLNGDGRPDLICFLNTKPIWGQGGEPVVLLNTGDGTFASPVTYPFGARCLSVGDFNGDGVPDLLIPSWTSTANSTLLIGKGDGAFTPHDFDLRGVLGVATLDLNHDGKLDVIAATEGKFSMLLGDGFGGIARRFERNAADISAGFEVADFNADGILDFACIQRWNEIGIWLGQRDGAHSDPPFFKDPIMSPFPQAAVCAVGDFNGDGIPDLIASGVGEKSGGMTFVLLGKGDGTFAPRQPIFATDNREWMSIVVGDFNGDGWDDFVLADEEPGKVNVFLNTTMDPP